MFLFFFDLFPFLALLFFLPTASISGAVVQGQSTGLLQYSQAVLTSRGRRELIRSFNRVLAPWIASSEWKTLQIDELYVLLRQLCPVRTKVHAYCSHCFFWHKTTRFFPLPLQDLPRTLVEEASRLVAVDSGKFSNRHLHRARQTKVCPHSFTFPICPCRRDIARHNHVCTPGWNCSLWSSYFFFSLPQSMSLTCASFLLSLPQLHLVYAEDMSMWQQAFAGLAAAHLPVTMVSYMWAACRN